MNEHDRDGNLVIPLTRRGFLEAAAVATAGLVLPRRAFASWEPPQVLSRAIASSPLVYVTPLRSDGSESRCKGEVWYAADGADLLVVTNPGRWRAAAISRGLDRARLWVGDYGLWKQANERFREAPGCLAKARIETDRAVHARALEVFGKKYAASWSSWGPRFEKGLASGERVMIRYTPSAD